MASVFLTNCDQTWPRSQQECRRLMRFALAQLMPCSPSHNEPGVSSSSTRLTCTDGINPKGIGDVVKVLKVMSSNTCYRLSLWALLVKCLLGECHKTSLMISKHLCHQATSHYLNKCWCRPLSPYHVTKQYWVKPEYKYFFWETQIWMNLHLVSFLFNKMSRVVEIFPHGSQETPHLTSWIPWLLMPWWSFIMAVL